MAETTKSGRTLLISNQHHDYELVHSGIKNIHTTDNGSRFVVFDTVENASKAYEFLVSDNITTKYSYYKSFFRLRDIDLDQDYNTLKNSILNVLSSHNLNVIYFKFYTKNKKLIGSGDLTIDTKESIDSLINDKNIKINDGVINFYRFKLNTKLDEVKESS